MQHHETVPLVAVHHGSGPWLYDHDGHRYLDAISSWWVNLFGHANPRINAALKQQLDTALADLENERRAGDAMQESLANLRNENAELQESYKRLYSRKEFLECRFTEFKRQSLMYYKKYVEELGGRIDANKKLKRLEKSRWYVRLRRWARRQWEYDIYA